METSKLIVSGIHSVDWSTASDEANGRSQSMKSHIMGSATTSKFQGHGDVVTWFVRVLAPGKVSDTAKLVSRLPCHDQ